MSLDFRMSIREENSTTISNTSDCLAENKNAKYFFDNGQEYCGRYREGNCDTKYIFEKPFCLAVDERTAADHDDYPRSHTTSRTLSDLSKDNRCKSTIDEALPENHTVENNDSILTPNIPSTALQRKTVRNKTATDRLTNFLKSLCVLCDICDDQHTKRVIRLNRQEKIIGTVILKKIHEIGLQPKKVIHTKIPEKTCTRCFSKIILFYNRLRHRQRKIKEETESIMEPSSHGYQCNCYSCQNEYGHLPVLLEGIEERLKMENSENSQVNAQPSHGMLHMSQSSEPSIGYQEPLSVATSHSQTTTPFSEHEYGEEFKPYQSQNAEQYQIPQSTIQGYNYSQPEQVDRTEVDYKVKSEIYVNQRGSSFQELRLQYGEQHEVKEHCQSQYYSSEANVSSVQTFVDDGSRDHLPTLLEDLETSGHPDLANQPSTSSESQPQDEKQSKKIKICAHCSKRFTHKGDFNKHLRKHSKEKPYKCSYCDKMFSNTSNLHRHQRIHSGVRPFRCQHCDKCFNRKDKLGSHRKSKFCKTRRFME